MKLNVSIKQIRLLNQRQLKGLVQAFPVPYFQLSAIDPKALKVKENIVISNDVGSYVFLQDTADFYPLPNIGQMIEFLIDKVSLKDVGITTDICDDLWDKVVAELGVS